MSNPLTNRRITHKKRFDPSDMGGLQLWLDAADVSSMVFDGSGLVERWIDKSKNGRDATQGTAGLRPSITRDTLTGLTALRFQDDALISEFTYTLGSAFVVWEHTDAAIRNFAGIAMWRSGFTNQGIMVGVPSANQSTRFYLQAVSNDITCYVNGVVTPISPNLFNSGVGVDVRISPNRWNDVCGAFTAPATISRRLNVGLNPNGSVYHNDVKIAEIIVFEQTLQPEQVAYLRTAYLIPKWGLAS